MSDTEITFTGAYTCTNHNDRQRVECPVCLVASLTTERDQLRADRTYNHECINRLAVATGTLGEKSGKVVDVALSTIDQLRADVERVRSDRDCEKRLRKDADELRENAIERAERYRLATLKLDAKLAAEREKVRVLRKALENVKDAICRDIPDGYSQSCVDQSADECDKIIDAAMKEAAK